MKTEYLSGDQIARAVEWLSCGEPVAMPTETVYGLAAPVFNEEAIARIFQIKGRPRDNPLIAHISSLSMVSRIAASLPREFSLLAESFWPGPLTLILPKHPSVPPVVSGGHETIAIRMPSHPVALQLIEAMGEPLVAPSANLSGKPSPTNPLHVLEDFDGIIAAVLDGGECEFGLESTVLNLTSETPEILRPGAISREAIENLLGRSLGSSNGPAVSPGMKYRHYAPKTPIRLIEHESEIGGPFVLSTSPLLQYPHRPLKGRTLYRYLREADAIGAECIYVLLDSAALSDEALMNRLLKAAGIK